MYPTYGEGNYKNFKLSQDDINGIQKLYGNIYDFHISNVSLRHCLLWVGLNEKGWEIGIYLEKHTGTFISKSLLRGEIWDIRYLKFNHAILYYEDIDFKF